MNLPTAVNAENNYIEGVKKGIMLTMLAEVASQKLYHETQMNENASPTQPTRKKRLRTSGLRTMSVKQLQALSVNQLINLFAILDGDEMKKTFYYQCKFSAPTCSARFFSFGSEDKARILIKDHLLKHVQSLQPDFEIETPKKELKRCEQSIKKCVKGLKKVMRPKQAETVVSSDGALEPVPVPDVSEPTSPNPVPANSTPPPRFNNELDHDYHRRSPTLYEPKCELTVADQAMVKQDICFETQHVLEISDSETFQTLVKTEDSHQWEKTIISNQPWLFMPVVGHEEIVISTEAEFDDGTKQQAVGTENVLGGVEVKTEPNCSVNPESESIEAKDLRVKKPKGKAKFIGQSAAEKEMAMQMIKAVKRKQISSDSLECQICQPPRLFTAPTTLISHYRSHAGIKPYECLLCKAVFTRQHSLNYHLLIHLNQTRFTCDDCGRKFRHPSHFKEHQRRHTGESPFECSDCNLRFKTRNTFKRHLKTRHGKVLTQSGGIIVLTEEEFRRVRTCPREKLNVEAKAISDLDKENSRSNQMRTRVNILRKTDKTENTGFITLQAEERLPSESEREIITATNAITSVAIPVQIEQPTIMLLSPNNTNFYAQKLYIT